MRLTSLAFAAATLTTACSSQQLADFNQAMKPKAGQPAPAAPATPAGGSVRGYEPSTEQVQALKRHIGTGTGDAAMAQARQEAATHIERAVMGHACQPKAGAGGAFMNTMMAPNTMNMLYFPSPRQGMHYDTGSQCLDVVRVDGWTMPARNALNFRAVFASKASGEGASRSYQMVKQPEGAWLFTAVN
jgi:hypothetical protein